MGFAQVECFYNTEKELPDFRVPATVDDLQGTVCTLRAESEKTGTKRWVISFTAAD